jgi:hypothetical protein
MMRSIGTLPEGMTEGTAKRSGEHMACNREAGRTER